MQAHNKKPLVDPFWRHFYDAIFFRNMNKRTINIAQHIFFPRDFLTLIVLVLIVMGYHIKITLPSLSFYRIQYYLIRIISNGKNSRCWWWWLYKIFFHHLVLQHFSSNNYLLFFFYFCSIKSIWSVILMINSFDVASFKQTKYYLLYNSFLFPLSHADKYKAWCPATDEQVYLYIRYKAQPRAVFFFSSSSLSKSESDIIKFILVTSRTGIKESSLVWLVL
jgi:hypothetical protein